MLFVAVDYACTGGELDTTSRGEGHIATRALHHARKHTNLR
jgi:hypothetical protein